MTLIALLIVLTIERVATKSGAWQFSTWFNWWQAQPGVKHSAEKQGMSYWFWLMVPVLIVGMVYAGSSWLIVQFFFDIIIMLICIGSADYRASYKGYLNAASRNDTEARLLYAEQLGCNDTNNETLGQTLVWVNYRFYCAVLFWFAILGAPGAVLYCMVREAADKEWSKETSVHGNNLSVLLHLLDWIPVRLLAFGFMVIGNFSRAAGQMVTYLLDFKTPARQVVISVSGAAEEVDVPDCDCITEPGCMVRLAKRNVMFFMTLVALLTLYGGIR